MAQQHINLGIPNNEDGNFVRDAFDFTEDNFTELYALQFFTDRIISGDVTLVSGLTFDVRVDSYIKNGQSLPITQPFVRDTVTLPNGDATNPRIDVIAITEDEQIVVIPGIPAVDPSEPVVDFDTEIKITSILIQANATTADNITSIRVFDDFAGEPTEWTGIESTGGLRINMASNIDPDLNSTSIETTGVLIGDRITFTNDLPISTSGLSAVRLRIKKKNTGPSQFQIRLFSGGTISVVNSVFVSDGRFGFLDSDTTNYQTISLSAADLGITTPDFDSIQITNRGFNGSDFLLDDVSLTYGVINPISTTPGINLIHAPNENGAGANTQIGTNIKDLFIYENELVFEPGITNNSFILQLSDTFKDTIPTNTSDLNNNGDDTINPFITLLDIPAPVIPNLQEVTDTGNTTTNSIDFTDTSSNKLLFKDRISSEGMTFGFALEDTIASIFNSPSSNIRDTNGSLITVETDGIFIKSSPFGGILLNSIEALHLRTGNQLVSANLSNSLLTLQRDFEFPDASGTLALVSDLNFEGYSESGTRAGGDLVVILGDHDETNNGTLLIIDDNNESFEFQSANGIQAESYNFFNNGSKTTLGTTILTQNNSIIFPDASGTVLLDAPSDGNDYVRNNGVWNISGGGAAQSLQDTTDIGNITTNSLIISSFIQSGEDITVTTFNKRYDIIKNPSGNPILTQHYSRWNGSSFVFGAALTLGENAGTNNTGVAATLIGVSSGQNNTGPSFTSIGHASGINNTGEDVSVLGVSAGQNNTADETTLIGVAAGENNTGTIVAIGHEAARNNTAGNIFNSNVGIGNSALTSNAGSGVTAVGHSSGFSNLGDNSIFIGRQSGLTNVGDQIVAIGSNSVFAGSGDSNIGIGQEASYYITGNNNIGIGKDAFYNGAGINNIGIGELSSEFVTGSNNIGIGLSSGTYLSGIDNIAIGRSIFSNFIDDVASQVTFDFTDITGQDINIPNHGLGADGTWVNIRFTQGTSFLNGYGNGQIYQVFITDSNTITSSVTTVGNTERGQEIFSVGTGTGHIFTPTFKYNNSVAIGNTTNITKSNQIVLGNTLTEDLLINNYNFNVDQVLTATEDGYVMTYNDTSGQLELQVASGGSVQSLQDIHDGTDGTGNFANDLFLQSSNSNDGWNIGMSDGGSFIYTEFTNPGSNITFIAPSSVFTGTNSTGLFLDGGSGNYNGEVFLGASGDLLLYNNNSSTSVGNEIRGTSSGFFMEHNTVNGTNRFRLQVPTIGDSVGTVELPALNLGVATTKYVPLKIFGQEADSTGNVNTGYTVATLPAGETGARTYVTDGSVVAEGNFGTTVVGAGANTVPVFYDGTNWIIA